MKTWMDIFKDPVFIISQTVIWQFFFLVLLFSLRPSQMADQAKIIVLQTYVAIVVGVVGFWIGAKVSLGGTEEKKKDG